MHGTRIQYLEKLAKSSFGPESSAAAADAVAMPGPPDRRPVAFDLAGGTAVEAGELAADSPLAAAALKILCK